MMPYIVCSISYRTALIPVVVVVVLNLVGFHRFKFEDEIVNPYAI